MTRFKALLIIGYVSSEFLCRFTKHRLSFDLFLAIMYSRVKIHTVLIVNFPASKTQKSRKLSPLAYSKARKRGKIQRNVFIFDTKTAKAVRDALFIDARSLAVFLRSSEHCSMIFAKYSDGDREFIAIDHRASKGGASASLESPAQQSHGEASPGGQSVNYSYIFRMQILSNAGK